jgi:ferredoxin
MFVQLDRVVCRGCALCNLVCPEVFRVDDDGKAALWMQQVPAVVAALCMAVEDQCPSGAIKLMEVDPFEAHAPWGDRK